MPVGKIPQNPILPICGLELAAIEAGVRYLNRKDLVLMKIADDAVVSGVFTQNIFKAAPVIICQRHRETTPKYLLINTGNANAGTGDKGIADALLICETLAKTVGVNPTEIWPFSTGVTVEYLPVEPILQSIPKLVSSLSADNWLDAAEGIMTTDTVPKFDSVEFDINGKKVRISGITKGSGMIKPNMATMLSFIATDANINQSVLDEMLRSAVDQSFNRITIDGDTSTNDACVLIATGKSCVIQTATDKAVFFNHLLSLMQRLAQYMVRDAEGASKFITVTVSGGASNNDCLAVAYKIAHSPLVKTAFFASDANIGRIMVAVGNAEVVNLDAKRITMYIGGIKVLDNGVDRAYQENQIADIMRRSEIEIAVDLNMGLCNETVWTCDLSYDYVKINADYRT